MEELAVELKDIRLEKDGQPILRGISVSIPKGKSTIIMGPSGSGKSTLLKVAAGIIVPDSGIVKLLGKDLNWISDRDMLDIRKRNGFVFQDAALWSNKSLYQNLELPLRFHFKDMDPEEIRKRITSFIEKIEFRDPLSSRPSQLSAGEQKMISFIRALITDPDILFMDEPTTSIDSASVDRIVQMIRDLKRRGKTIVAVTHYPKLASLISDYMVVVKGGEVLVADDFRTVVKSSQKDIQDILTQVLSESASFDSDLLELLEPEGDDSH